MTLDRPINALCRRFQLMVIAGFSTTLLNGCGRSEIAWKEEVRLQSGKVVTVQRTAKTKPFGEIGGAGGWENEGMTIQIIDPKAEDDPPQWDQRFVPLVFDREPGNGQWFVVATFYSCTSWYELGKPALPYTEFRLKDGKWVQVSLTQSLIGREANLLTSIKSSGEGNHTLQSKSGVMSNDRIAPEYKRVVSNWKTGC